MSTQLLEKYLRTATRYDELLYADGTARLHWEAMLKFLSESAPEAMEHRVQVVRRQVRENGVTYNVYADPLGTDRPWDLDIVPMILSANEWAMYLAHFVVLPFLLAMHVARV